eukprot:1141106-Pelagomonas_calceolata.AAC.4
MNGMSSSERKCAPLMICQPLAVAYSGISTRKDAQYILTYEAQHFPVPHRHPLKTGGCGSLERINGQEED